MTDPNKEKTPTIMSDAARFTRRKFIGVLIVLSLKTTRHTRELPSKLIATITEQTHTTDLENGISNLQMILSYGRLAKATFLSLEHVQTCPNM